MSSTPAQSPAPVKKKSRQAINRAIRSNEESIVVVTGCYAQAAPGEVAGIDGVDLVIGTKIEPRWWIWLKK